jgi:hypothetical protein
MTAATFDLVKDIFLLIFFYLGTAWMWGKIKLKPNDQAKLEHIFTRSRTRFKWLFLAGALALTGLFVYQYFL